MIKDRAIELRVIKRKKNINYMFKIMNYVNLKICCITGTGVFGSGTSNVFGQASSTGSSG